jgi:chromosome segregation ATPase
MVLFLYRQIDRHSQSMNKVQKYAAALKQDLTEFVAEKEAAVKDYAISLDVQQKAAKELLRRLQLTDEELAAKASAVTRIDERLNAYDVSLKELIEMSVRVQENLNRIREESAFVEKVNKRVGDSKEKFEAIEQGLGEVERRFAAENTAALEKIAQQVVAAVENHVADLQSVAEQVEHRVEESREAVERSEHIRTERIARDMDFINRSLDEALEQAAIRADNMENAAVIKLRDQAVERIHELQTAVEDQLDAHMENARNQINALQDLVTECKDSWKADAIELEGQQRSLKEEWNQDIQNFQDRLESQRDALDTALESENDKIKRLVGDLKTISDESKEHLSNQTAIMEERLELVRRSADAMIADLEHRFAARVEEIEGASTEIKTHFTAETDSMEQRLKELERDIDKAIAALQNQIASAGEHIEKTVLEDATAQFNQWKQESETWNAESRQTLTDMKESADAFKAEFTQETQDIARQLNELQDTMTENVRQLQDQMANTAAETQGQIAEEMANRLDRWKETAEEGDQRSRQLLTDLETIAAETEKYISNEIERVNGRLDSIQHKIDALAGHIESEISEAEERALAMADTELEKWKQAVEEADDKARQTLSAAETALEDTQRRIADEIAVADRQIDALKSKLDATASHIEVELVNALANAKEQGLILADDELDKWKRAIETQNGKAQDLLGSMETALEDAKQRAGHDIAGVAERLEELQSKLEETAAHIESEFAHAEANAHDQAAALAEQELERWKQAVETEDVKVQNVLAGIELSLTDTKERISSEITGVSGQLETLQAKLDETASQIETKIRGAIADAQEQAILAADGELDKWKTAAEARDAEARQTLADLETDLNAAKEQVSQGIAGIAENLAKFQTEAGEITNRIEEEIGKAATAVETQASEAAARELERWNQSVATEDAKIREEIADLETLLGNAKQQILNEITGVREQTDRLETKIAETSAAIEATMTAAMQNAEQQAAELAAGELDKWKETVTAEDARLRTRLADIEVSLGDMDRQITGEISNAQGRIEYLQSKIDETCDTIEATMTAAVQNAEQQAAELAAGELDKWKETVTAEDARLRMGLEDLEADLQNAKRRISAEIVETAGQFETLQTKISDTTDHIETLLTETVGKAEELASKRAEEELEKWSLAVETEETKVRDLLSQIAAETASAAGQFDDVHAKITSTAERIKSAMDEAVQEAETKALALSDRGLERWKAVAEEGDQKARELLAELETAYSETEGRFDEIQAKIHETAAQIEGIMTEAVHTAEGKAQTLSDRGLERWREAAEEGDARSRQLFTELERVSAETKQRVFDEITAVQGRFEAIQAKIEGIAGDIETQMAQAVNDAEEKSAALAGAGLEKWKTAMAEENAKTQGIIRDLQDVSERSSQSAADMEERLSQIGEELERKAAEDAARRLEQWKRSADAMDAEVRQVMADLEASFTAAKGRIADEIAGEENRITNIESRIDEAAALLEREMALVVGKAKEKALEAATEEETKIRQQLADLKSVFMDMKTQLFDEITTVETRIGAIQNQIDHTYTHIEDELAKAMGKAEEQALGIADAGLEKWKAKIDGEDARIQQLLTALNRAAAESEQTATAAAAGLEKITDDMERRIGAVADERLENWKVLTADSETAARRILAEVEAASGQIKAHFDAEQSIVEARLKDAQTYADQAIAHLKAQVEQYARNTEQQALEDMDARLEKWKSLTEAEDVKAQALLSTLHASSETIEQRIQTLRTGMDTALAELEARLQDAAETVERKILEETDAKFEEYQAAQAEQFKRLETLADDTSGLDAELRRYMGDIENRVRKDFSQFEQDSANDREKAAAQFDSAIDLMKTEMDAVEQELDALKAQAYQNVSEQFRVFEDDFSNDLSRRSGVIEQRLAEWQDSLNQKLTGFMEESSAEYQNRERAFNEELQNKFVEQHTRILSELERLQAETAGFQERIQDRMRTADDSLASLKTQFHQNITETMNTAEASVKAELERHARSMTDNLKQNQQALEAQVKTVSEQAEARNRDMTGMLEVFRRDLDKWQTGFTAELQGLDASMNEARRRSQELLAESDARFNSIQTALNDANTEADARRSELFARIDEEVKTLDSAIKEADRHIKEFAAQTMLFERTDELKAELERRLEELRGDFDRIDQRRLEAMDLEGQFLKIKRLEDEVNTKMTRFLSEKHRIEQMETEFNRLLQVSAAVEEKLAEVSDSDDTLQQIQIHIRKLNDALSDTEEKYQRIEKKNQTLDATNDGIDRNFKSLQESEKMTRHIADELNSLTTDIGSLRSSVTNLTEENNRARDIADKLSLLDSSLSTIEERIEDMQKARQWLARAETRLEDLNKQILDQVKLIDGHGARSADKILDDDKGAPSLGVRDNIIRLARLGWTVDEIARTMKRSRGEVELVLEIMPKE